MNSCCVAERIPPVIFARRLNVKGIENQKSSGAGTFDVVPGYVLYYMAVCF